MSKVWFESNVPPAGLLEVLEKASNTHSYWCCPQHCLELNNLCSLIVLSLTSSLWVILDSSITCPTKAKPQAANCLAVTVIPKHVRAAAAVLCCQVLHIFISHDIVCVAPYDRIMLCTVSIHNQRCCPGMAYNQSFSHLIHLWLTTKNANITQSPPCKRVARPLCALCDTWAGRHPLCSKASQLLILGL